jgi:hypothetical protein
VRLDGDEMAADADDGDAGHFSGTYMRRLAASPLQGPNLSRVDRQGLAGDELRLGQ